MLEYNEAVIATDKEAFTDALSENTLGLSVCETIPDALVVAKDKPELDVSGATTDLLSDCLDTLRVNEADSVEIEDIVWLNIAVVFWGATKNDIQTYML